MRQKRALPTDAQEVLAALGQARSSGALRWLLGWPVPRVARAIARLEDAGIIRTGKCGREVLVTPKSSPPIAAREAQEVAVLSLVLQGLGREGWSEVRRRGHRADLRREHDLTGVVAVYPLGVRAPSVRRAIRALITLDRTVDVFLVYTSRPAPLRRAYWPKVSRPALEIRELSRADLETVWSGPD